MRKVLPLVALVAGLAWSGRAEAVSLRLGAGANYWFTGNALFDATFAAGFGIVPHLSAGVRGGLAFTAGPNELGLPLDLDVRFSYEHLYLEGLAGPWIFFHPAPVYAHAALGAGLNAGPISVGLEAGYLSPRPILGLNLAFRF